jgi:hypothetical protein
VWHSSPFCFDPLVPMLSNGLQNPGKATPRFQSGMQMLFPDQWGELAESFQLVQPMLTS